MKLAWVAIQTSLTFVVATGFGLSGCASSVARDYASSLAANTNQLNDQIEKLTRSRREIENTRARLTSIMELSTAQNEQYVGGQLAEWAAASEIGTKAATQRTKLFAAIRTYTEAASKKQDEVDALKRTVAELSVDAKGDRSAKLGETSAKLAILSDDSSLKDKVKFLVSYAQSVQKSIKESEKDAGAAATSAAKTADKLEMTVEGKAAPEK